MKIYLCFIIIFIISAKSLFAQINDASIRIETLENNEIGKKIIYGKWTENGGTETELTYLGTLKVDKADYKILNSSWIWGMSKRATNRIIIFDSENKYVGNYYVTTKCDLPNRIENENLIFKPSECEGCDKIETKIHFNNGIPKEIFINCKGKYGSLYSFDNLETE